MIFGNVLKGKCNSIKNRQMKLHDIKKLLDSKTINKMETTYKMGKINLHILHLIGVKINSESSIKRAQMTLLKID
jgi:hypothetical protein